MNQPLFEPDNKIIDWDNIDKCFISSDIKIDLKYWQELYKIDGLPPGVL